MKNCWMTVNSWYSKYHNKNHPFIHEFENIAVYNWFVEHKNRIQLQSIGHYSDNLKTEHHRKKVENP